MNVAEKWYYKQVLNRDKKKQAVWWNRTVHKMKTKIKICKKKTNTCVKLYNFEIQMSWTSHFYFILKICFLSLLICFCVCLLCHFKHSSQFKRNGTRLYFNLAFNINSSQHFITSFPLTFYVEYKFVQFLWWTNNFVNFFSTILTKIS